ncbi:Detected protein of confused Function [Hibiscus syriacus]|uniref:Detected protein of confused Function n=1 Tax=Hibiscus syriacus TaxID=106335 RepID=A0A6A2Z036_HIBSY|nr:Detected protein of confused Function [Hibiscus syriacus]
MFLLPLFPPPPPPPLLHDTQKATQVSEPEAPTPEPEKPENFRQHGKIFIGNLPNWIKKHEVFEFFRQFGPIKDVILIKAHSETHRNASFGFFIYGGTPPVAEKMKGHFLPFGYTQTWFQRLHTLRQDARSSNDYTKKFFKLFPPPPPPPLLHDTQKATQVSEPEAPTPEPEKPENFCQHGKIFIGNLPNWIKKLEVSEFFHQFGPIKDVILIKAHNETHRNAGFGFVIYGGAPPVAEKMKGQFLPLGYTQTLFQRLHTLRQGARSVDDYTEDKLFPPPPPPPLLHDTQKTTQVYEPEAEAEKPKNFRQHGKIFIGNLPNWIKKHEDFEFFRQFGPIKDVILIKAHNETHRIVGFGFVMYGGAPPVAEKMKGHFLPFGYT